ncbi:9879_t:CDS:2, partial [Racocetra fulgida]
YTHGTYNIPCANLISLPEEAINEFKETIVYLIQHQLSNHSSLVGSRCITIPCLESEYAYETLQSIFGDNNWGIRHYMGNQQTAVILFTPTQTEDVYNNTKNSGFDTLPQEQNTANIDQDLDDKEIATQGSTYHSKVDLTDTDEAVD